MVVPEGKKSRKKADESRETIGTDSEETSSESGSEESETAENVENDDGSVCHICRKLFYKTNNFTRHIKLVHSKGKLPIYKCPRPHLNPPLYKHRRNLRRHLRNDHSITSEARLDALCEAAKTEPTENKPKNASRIVKPAPAREPVTRKSRPTATATRPSAKPGKSSSSSSSKKVYGCVMLPYHFAEISVFASLAKNHHKISTNVISNQ